MMDQIYALGVSCIEVIQYWFSDAADYFEFVNDASNPHYIMEYLFPFVSAIDSVFGAQLLLCMSFGGWLNAVMKWWLLEDRPYWWIRETSFYTESERPRLRQTRHTCETGPGSPSGHSTTMAMVLLLFIMWISHVMNDRKYYIFWWKYLVYPVFGAALGSVMLARMFVATHFPHQVLAGALVGCFLAPALCIYVSDPYIWGHSAHCLTTTRRSVMWHTVSAAITGLVAVVTYWSLVLCGIDPHYTLKLAFRWCESPESIHVSTTPMYALIYSTGSLLGWALWVTPAIAKYRHYTKERSLIISAFSSILMFYISRYLHDSVTKASAWKFYTLHFILSSLRPALFLRLTPLASMWPYSNDLKTKTD